jgi:hypothetical protein
LMNCCVFWVLLKIRCGSFETSALHCRSEPMGRSVKTLHFAVNPLS